MAASALMSLGVRAMTANYAALQTTGNNIANANTAGYSRQSTVLETAGGQFTGAGFFGKGVNVTTIERAHSEFLTREAAATRSVAAADAARSTQMARLESVFQLGESGLAYAASEMFNAFVDVANAPADASARQVVLARADELASRFSTAADQLDTLQSGVTQDLKAQVASVNMLAEQVASLNAKIAALKGTGHTANDLLDQRDSAISELSEHLQVNTIAAEDGSLSVFIGGGQKLVLGGQATTLVTLADSYDPAKLQIGVEDAGTVRQLPQGLIAGGTISGLLQFQNSDLVDARNQLGQLAAAIAGAVNEQQALGLDLGTPASAGAAMFSVGSPRVLASANNAGTAGVSLTVVDSSRLLASDYELYADPTLASGSYTLTRRSDGQTFTVADGDVVDGFQIGVAAPLPTAGDRFLLQAVAPAAGGIALMLDDPDGIAAASPVEATLDTDNTGTASVAALTATSANAAGTALTASISFTDDSGNYAWELRDASNALVRSGTASWTAGTPIDSAAWLPATPAASYDWSLSLNGVPKSGDTLSVGATTLPASNNGNANALLALRDAAIVGERVLTSGTVVAGDSVTDAYANTLADIGVRAQGAALSAEQSGAMAEEASTALANETGVNLDEEAARLIQFQQSYQAAAKMLQVAQALFDTLLQAAGA